MQKSVWEGNRTTDGCAVYCHGGERSPAAGVALAAKRLKRPRSRAPRPARFAIGFGATLLGLVLSTTSATAAPMLDVRPGRCEAPCTETFRFVRDTGGSYNITWHGKYLEGRGTTCSDANPSRCVQRVTYTEPGRYAVKAVYGPGPYDYANTSAWVRRDDEEIAPLRIYGNRRLRSPRDVLTVVTDGRLKNLSVVWRSSKTVRAPGGRDNLEGTAVVRRAGRRNGKNVFKVRIYVGHLVREASNPGASSNGRGSSRKPLVRPGRLELPRTIRSTRPSTLRVYQFRHRRVTWRIIEPPQPAARALAVVRPPRYGNEHMFDSVTASDRDGGAGWSS